MWYPRRRFVVVALVVTAMVAAPAVIAGPAPVAAQPGPPTGLCLLTLDEVEDATGLTFTSSRGTLTDCTYESDPAIDMFALDLRLDEGPDLEVVRYSFTREGRETSVAGLPAWSSLDGLFVDVGEHLLVVQPILFLSDNDADPVSAQDKVAELVVPRLGPVIDAAIAAAQQGPAGLAALFPEEIAGQPLFADVMRGEDFLRFVDLGTEGIEAVLTGHGRSLQDVSVGSASVGDAELIALRVPGLDAAVLVPPIVSFFGGPDASSTPVMRGGREVIEVESLAGISLLLMVSGDVLWMVNQADDQTLDAIIAALP